MNEYKLDRIRRTIKELEEQKILMLDLEIVYELDCQLQFSSAKEISTEDYCKLYEEIERAYLKTEGVALDSIVSCALDHIRRILDDDETFDLRKESCEW